MLALAAPVVIAELGWMAMGVVDTLMVGRLGAEAIGAVSIGSILFYTIGVFGTGLLLGLDTLVPQAFGADDVEDCHRSLIQAVYGSSLLAPLLMAPMFLLLPLMNTWGVDPTVAELAGPYTRALLWSTLPLLLFMSFRHYLQGMNVVRPIMFVLVSANLVNVVANWLLIFGNGGFPAFGVAGAGWASCVSRIYMCAAILGYLLVDAKRRRTGLLHARTALDVDRIRRIVSLGFPAAVQRALELGVFATATAIIGTINAASLAAHQIALNAAAVTFMVPLGISSAAAVRVGQAIGRGDPEGANRAGWTALALGGAFMTFAGLCFLAFPEPLIRVYTAEPAVVELGVILLYLAALFQLFDGFQVVATGALRGAGDTRTPMIANLVGHWFIGLPVGWWLCFRMGWAAPGIWVGLSVGLIVVGMVLLYFWSTRLGESRRQTSR